MFRVLDFGHLKSALWWILLEAFLSEAFFFFCKLGCLTGSASNQFIRPRKLSKWRHCPWSHTYQFLWRTPDLTGCGNVHFLDLGKNLISGKRSNDKTHKPTSSCLQPSFTGNAFTKKIHHCQSLYYQTTRNSSIFTYKSHFRKEESRELNAVSPGHLAPAK